MELSSAQLTDDAVPERVNDHKEPTMLIVDAQIHLWNAGNPTSPWHRQIPAYLKEHALKEMEDRKSTRLNSSHLVISYAVFCLKKKNTTHRPRRSSDYS